MNVHGLLAIARLTIREQARRRLLWALVGLTVVIVAVTGWGFQRIAEVSPVTGSQEALGLSQVLVMIAFMFSFVLAMTAVFAGAPALGGQVESGLALAVLARPIRRADLLLGTWLGLALVMVVYAFAAGAAELAVVELTTGYLPAEPLWAAAYMAGEGLVLLTLALVLSTRVSAVATGAVAVVAFGLTWMAGIMSAIGDLFHNAPLSSIGVVTRVILPSDILWRGAMHALEPPGDLLEAAGPVGNVFRVSPFFQGSAPPTTWIAWSVAWVVVALVVGAWLFRRREI